MSQNNQFKNNTNGRDGTDTNGVDFWVDGSGKGNCFQDNQSSTFSGSASLYPTCPAPADSGSGTATGDTTQLLELLAYAGSTPPDTMACNWDTALRIPKFKKYKPIDATQGDPSGC